MVRLPDWSPEGYGAFRSLRLRPALDLLRAVPPLPPGKVVDLGCGNGAVGEALGALGRLLFGVDASPAMLATARDTGAYHQLVEADIARWADEGVALLYSNAALHWLPDHAALLPRLAASLGPGGTLAVQMPRQNDAPSHRLWRSLAEELYPGRLRGSGPGAMAPRFYDELLSPLGQFSLWETEYYQRLGPTVDAHPVRRFTETTYGRSVLQALDETERAQLTTAYDAAVERAYPRADDGSVLFPFRRVFFVLTVG